MNTIEGQRDFTETIDYITNYSEQRAKFERLLGSMASNNSAFGENDINGIKQDIDSFREKFENIMLIDPNANKISEILDQLNQQIREYNLKHGIKEEINIANSTEKAEGFGDRLLNHFDQKYELEKCIEQEISDPNSAFATNDIVGINKFYDKLKIEFADLVKGNQVIERVLNKLCYEVPQFYSRKEAYEQKPTQLVREVLEEHLKNLEYDPNIIDQLENLDQITVSFDKPPTIVIMINGQRNMHLLNRGNLEYINTIQQFGFDIPQMNMQVVEKNSREFQRTLVHENYHKKTFTQVDSFYDFNSQKPEEFMESGHLGFEELLACFVSEDDFGAKAKFKTYLPDDINPNDCNNIELTIKKTQTALHKLRLAYMKYKGLSDTEAREKIGCGFRNHYTQGGGRIMKTSNIPKIVDSMILAMQGQIREEQLKYIIYDEQRAKFERLLGSMASDNSAFSPSDINGIEHDSNSFKENFGEMIETGSETSEILNQLNQQIREYKLKNKLQETEETKEQIAEPVLVNAEKMETQKPSLLARFKRKLKKWGDEINEDNYT